MDGIYGPDGKLDVMASARERSKGVRVPEYAAHVRRLMETMGGRGEMTAQEMAEEQRALEAQGARATLQEIWKGFEAAERSREKAAAESLQGDIIDPNGNRDLWLSDGAPMRGMPGEEFGRRFIRHAPAGPNRAARRAAAAQARGRS